jgi:transcriptional regulator with XRE-family HTH domain
MSTHVGVIELTAALKQCLKSRGVTYGSLAEELRLSEASVKRLFSERSFTLKRIEAICSVLGMDFYELARLAGGHQAGESRLTREQERGLAADPKLLLVFQLLLNDWSAENVMADYAISRAEWGRLLSKLDRLRLIALQPGNLVRLRTSRRIAWRKDGPVRAAYQKLVLSEFFEVSFDGARAVLHFEGKELSATSVAVMKRKIERLTAEFNELSEMDATLKPSERTSVGMIVALRPYVLSQFKRLTRERR